MQTGSTIAHYSIVDRIGAGGMGEVFRAHDTKLRRDVALKVLPPEFGADPERVARFEREARTLASLQHPNVAAIFGLETVDDRPFLVMEMVEGENLAQRVEKGALPVNEALAVALQIAAGLEAAHELGIVHRDLKPANVMLTPDGQVKILDFGLARAYQDESSGELNISKSPTLTAAMTGAGVILGTAAYMSPEQARGHEVDRRTDIWACGCLIFELLTGTRAFPGDTTSDIIAAVLKSDPPWDRLPPDTPPSLLRLLRRCLEKDPRRRLHDVADARIEIEDLLAGRETVPETTVEVSPGTVGARARWFVPVAAVVALAAGLAIGRNSTSPEPLPQAPVQRLSLAADDFVPRTDTAIAPDGSAFVYPGRAEDVVWRLMIRRLDRFGSQPLEGTEYAVYPFFSHDGDWVAFSRDGVVRKIPTAGGPVQPVCEVGGEATGFWAPDGFLYITGTWAIADRMPAICRVPESGGTPELLLTASSPDELFFDPFLLPDGRTLLFTCVLRGQRIESLDLVTGERQVVLENGALPVLTPSGHLVYYDERGDRLMAAAFDPADLTQVGPPKLIIDQVTVFAVSPRGTIVYAPYAIRSDDIVVSVGQDGAWTPLLEEQSSWAQPRFAPDGKSILLRKTASPNCYLWRYDLARQVLTRVTFERDTHDATWSPDGRDIAFCATGDGSRSVFVMPADGSGPATQLLEAGNTQSSAAWSPTGNHIVFTQTAPTTGPDLYVVAVGDSAAVPEVYLQTDFAEDHARFSPDGRWIAYTSNESGRDEIYVRPFPGPGGKTQVSREGGNGAIWSPSGRELYYARGDHMMVIDVTPGEEFQVSAPREQFGGDFAFERVGNYDIAPDGQSFVVVRADRQDGRATGFNVIVNAFAELVP